MSTSSQLVERDGGRRETEEERARRFDDTDALDTAQIIDELKGKISEEYFYIIKDPESGRETPGLSFAGTKWIASQMAVGKEKHPLSVLHIEVVESPDGQTFRAVATVEDTATGERRPGVYEQSKFRRRNVMKDRKKIGEEEVMVDIYDGDQKIGRVPQRDPHAYTIAASKAMRNGLRHFMPEPMILELFQKWKASKGAKKEGPKDITGESKVSDVRPPPADLAGKPLEERLAYDLQPWLGEVQIVPGIDVVEVKMPTGMAEGPAKAIRQIMDTYSAKRSMQGNELSYTVAR